MASGRDVRNGLSLGVGLVATWTDEDGPDAPFTGEAGRSSSGEVVELSAPGNLWNLDGLEARGMAGEVGVLVGTEAFCFSMRSR